MFSSSNDIVGSMRLIDFGRAELVSHDPGPTWTDLSDLMYIMRNLGWERIMTVNGRMGCIRDSVFNFLEKLSGRVYSIRANT